MVLENGRGIAPHWMDRPLMCPAAASPSCPDIGACPTASSGQEPGRRPPPTRAGLLCPREQLGGAPSLNFLTAGGSRAAPLTRLSGTHRDRLALLVSWFSASVPAAMEGPAGCPGRCGARGPRFVPDPDSSPRPAGQPGLRVRKTRRGPLGDCLEPAPTVRPRFADGETGAGAGGACGQRCGLCAPFKSQLLDRGTDLTSLAVSPPGGAVAVVPNSLLRVSEESRP